MPMNSSSIALEVNTENSDVKITAAYGDILISPQN